MKIEFEPAHSPAIDERVEDLAVTSDFGIISDPESAGEDTPQPSSEISPRIRNLISWLEESFCNGEALRDVINRRHYDGNESLRGISGSLQISTRLLAELMSEMGIERRDPSELRAAQLRTTTHRARIKTDIEERGLEAHMIVDERGLFSDIKASDLSNVLTPRQREVLGMIFEEGRSLKEVADKLGITKAGVRSIKREAFASVKPFVNYKKRLQGSV